MHVTNSVYVSETSIEFTFDDGSAVTLEEVKPEYSSLYFAGSTSEAQARAIFAHINAMVI
jgi:hypothetical protein